MLMTAVTSFIYSGVLYLSYIYIYICVCVCVYTPTCVWSLGQYRSHCNLDVHCTYTKVYQAYNNTIEHKRHVKLIYVFFLHSCVFLLFLLSLPSILWVRPPYYTHYYLV